MGRTKVSKKFSVPEKAAIYREYIKGMSLSGSARRFNASKSTVHAFVTEKKPNKINGRHRKISSGIDLHASLREFSGRPEAI